MKQIPATRFNPGARRRLLLLLPLSFLCLLLPLGPALRAQVSPEEHAKHHPGQNKAGGTEGAAQGPGGMMGGAGGGGMDGMMEKMGAPKPKDLYPSLMELPDLPPARRAEVERQAHERMQGGIARMSEGLEELARSAPGSDFGAMQAATAKMREGLARFESGLAAHRALAEGKAPRNVALLWFKREMNLLPAAGPPGSAGPLGISWFHFLVMFILIGFAASMIWMYFLKMRRAAALIARLAGGGGGVPAAAAPSTPAPAPAEVRAAPVPSGERAVRQPGPPGKWEGELRVAAVFQETPDVRTFRLTNQDGGPIPFTHLPGQFLTLTVPLGRKLVKRSYTIASSPTCRDSIEITVKREDQGLVSRHLHEQLHPGDVLKLSAPGGYFTFTGEEHESIVLIAGGVGVTPMMSVVRYLTDRAWQGEIHLLFCCRKVRDIIFREELEYLDRRHPNLHVTVTVTRPGETHWTGSTGRLTRERIQQLVPDIRRRRVHICGPEAMMDAVKEALAQLGVPGSLVKTEAFGTARRRPKPEAAKAKGSGPEVPACNVTFSEAGKTAPLPQDKTVLDVAEELDVDIDSSCRSGTCGSCKVKLRSGEVSMECEDGLEPEEKAGGIVLACQARARTDIVVEA